MDNKPALRCSKAEIAGSITSKAFAKDAGFGDCPMQITYEFRDAAGRTVTGKHVGTESNYYSVKIGDRILIRYLESEPRKNAPKDSLGIIRPVSSHEQHS